MIYCVVTMRYDSSLNRRRAKNAGRVEMDHIINCDIAPYVPGGWEIEEHRRGGQFAWDPARVSLYLSDSQRDGVIKGYQLYKELVNIRVLNANVLDYLLAHQEFIPKGWKVKRIFFWGTIYRHSGDLYVPYLDRDGYGWYGYRNRLDDGWSSAHPAASLAK